MGVRWRRTKLRTADWCMAVIPRRVPDKSALQNCKIISHRGEHDNKRVMENTLQAFGIARAAGVWGIECDIRWTADLVPVICHDPSGERVFGSPELISTLSFDEVRARMPLIPSLAELIAEFGGSTHLMLELKAERFPQPTHQSRILQRELSPLEPGRDYHILGLDPAVFELVDFLPRRFCCPVAEENVGELCQTCVDRGFGGLGGHFLLLNHRVKRRLDQAGQPLGTGFVASKNCLYRELNRGVEWIFSNHAVKLQQVRDRCLERG